MGLSNCEDEVRTPSATSLADSAKHAKMSVEGATSSSSNSTITPRKFSREAFAAATASSAKDRAAITLESCLKQVRSNERVAEIIAAAATSLAHISKLDEIS